MSTLKKQFISGVFYTAAAKYIGLLIQLLITAVLSRLLTPSDFGVVAIATVFIVFFNLLTDFGIGVAVIQDKTLQQQDMKGIFTFSILLGICLSAAFFMLAIAIARIYSIPILNNICHLLSLSVLFTSLNVIPNALLLREKQFKFIAARTLVVQLLGGAMGIIAALMGKGVYALVIHSISSSFFLFIINYVKNPLGISLKIDLGPVKRIFGYSVYQFAFNFVNYFSRNLDTLFIGRFLSTSALGYYDKAYRLMLLPIENLTHVLSPVIHPFFSDFQKDKRKILEGYSRIVYFLAIIGFPLSAFLHFASEEIIFIVFGPQWRQSIPIFQILALSVGFQIVLSSSGSIFQAANNTKLLFISGLLSAFFMVVSICYGVFILKSLQAVAYGLLAAFIINFLQCYILLIKVVLKGSFSKFLIVFRGPAILFLLICITEFLYRNLLKINGILPNFVLKTLLSGIVIAIGIFLTGDYRSIKTFLLSFKKR